MKPSCNG